MPLGKRLVAGTTFAHMDQRMFLAAQRAGNNFRGKNTMISGIEVGQWTAD